MTAPADILNRPERIYCIDCARDGRAFNVMSEGHYCMVRERVWRSLGMQDYFAGVLCLACVERRLGRRLGLADFAVSRTNADRRFWRRGTLMLPRVWDEWTTIVIDSAGEGETKRP
jgi:hypothetical protein